MQQHVRRVGIKAGSWRGIAAAGVRSCHSSHISMANDLTDTWTAHNVEVALPAFGCGEG
jgi:hypothetical protein